MPDLVIYLNWTLKSEWYVMNSDSKNKYQKDMCSKGVRLHAQNMNTL